MKPVLLTCSKKSIYLLLTSVLLALFSATLKAQEFEIDTVRGVSPFYAYEVAYTFPSFRLIGNQAIADSINQDLLHSFLQIEPGSSYKSIFENVWGEEGQAMPNLSDLSFDIFTNNSTLLSLSISAEGCGAYCEYFTWHYTYDSKTGKEIQVADLFNAEGVEKLCTFLDAQKRNTITEFLERTRDSVSHTLFSDSSDREYYDEMISMYEDCLEYSFPTTSDYLQFQVEGATLTFILGRCSAHYNRNADELWEYEIPIDLFEWSPNLSDYGKQVFDGLQ
ncbi:MAG: hypothetical protein AB7H80_09025 [Candidatus Kapaibacterium sp.]